MTAVVFETPGLIDIRAFTTFGVNAKPNSPNPIGYFGTGLKYAVAVLCRLGIPITVWIGTTPHVFYSEATRFRDKEFALVRMRRQRGITAKWFREDLPFTTELGKNWALWQVMRELESNTRDENGNTRQVDGQYLNTQTFLNGCEGKTRIVVEGDAFAAEGYAKLAEIFLTGGVQKDGDRAFQVLTGGSKYFYFRGLRVQELRKPSLHTWNYLSYAELTEDRTLKWSHMMAYWARNYLVQSDDETLIRSCLEANEETFEGSFSYDLADAPKPSDTFQRLAPLYGRGSSVMRYVSYHAPTLTRTVRPWEGLLLDALEAMDGDEVQRLSLRHQDSLMLILAARLKERRSPTSHAAPPVTEVVDEFSFSSRFSLYSCANRR